MLAGFGESVRISVPIDDVGREQTAEEQDFGGQKCPETKPGRFVLLFQRVELMRENCARFSHELPPDRFAGNCRELLRRWAVPRNCARAEVKASAIRGRWSAMDSGGLSGRA